MIPGVFDPAVWIRAPYAKGPGVIGRLRLYGCRLTDIRSKSAQIVTGKGVPFTFTVLDRLQPSLEAAKGQLVSVAALYYEFHDSPVLVDFCIVKAKE